MIRSTNAESAKKATKAVKDVILDTDVLGEKPFRIVSDHLNHVEAIGKGKAWCLDVMGPVRSNASAVQWR